MAEDCICCGSTLHTARDCPEYGHQARLLLLMGAAIFVNRHMENSSYGQNLLDDFERALALEDETDKDEEG